MKLRSLFRAALLLAAPLAFAGCDGAEPSDFVNQERIYTDFDLHYDANRDVTVARASFRFGGGQGTQLELSESSAVSVNGQALQKVVQPVTNLTYYERTFAGLVGTGAFTFVDTEGRSYQNSVTLNPIGFAGAPGNIDNDASFTLPFTGAALAADEEANVVLFRILGGAALGVFNQNTDGAQSVILDRAQLQNVTPGQVTLVLERKITRDLTQPTAAGGRITGRYTPVNVQAQVVD